MSPKAEHLPLLANVGQRVRIVAHEDFFWKARDGSFGRIIGKLGPSAENIAAGREQVLYHVQLEVPVLGHHWDMWLNRRDFVLV